MSSELLAQAHTLVLEGELDEALVIALRLTEEGDPEALALAASVLGQRDENARLIELASAFCEQHGHLARAWELLGDAHSRGDSLAPALTAYENARAQPDADLGRIACSQASALLRAGAHLDARESLDALPDGSPYLVRAAMLRLQSCNATGEHQVGLDYVAQALAGQALTAPPGELAWLMVEEGHARLGVGDRQQAAVCGVRAAALDRGNKGALFVVREALDMRSSDAFHYRLQITADLLEQAGGGRFTAAYEVVADDPSEALALCQPLEPGATDFGLSAFDKGAPAPDLPKGVYARSGRELIPSPLGDSDR